MVQDILGLLLLCVVLLAAYSLICILIPLKPFATRSSATLSLGFSVLAIFAGVNALTFLNPSTPEQIAGEAKIGLGKQSALTAETGVDGDIPAPCGDGGLALNDVMAVTGDYNLRSSASASASKIKNEKASQALGRAHFHQIDGTTTVRRLCTQAEWTEIQIAAPDWLSHVKGWVPNEALREIDQTASGTRIYVEDDFIWDDDTLQVQATDHRHREQDCSREPQLRTD